MTKKQRRCGILTRCMTALLMMTAAISGFGRQPVCADETDRADTELSVDMTGKGDGYSAVLYDNTNGLPTSEANAVAETSDGFIWIGSYSGLIRYDGSNFERFDSSGGIASVTALFVDSKDRLWVGTNDAGAAVMVNGEFQMFNKKNGLTTLTVRDFSEDRNGNIYLATTNGLAVADPELNIRMLDDPQFSGEYIRMLRHSGGTVYGVTKNGDLFTVRDGKLTGWYSPETIGIPNIHSVFPDPQYPGYLYIGDSASSVFYGELTDSFRIVKQFDVSPCNYINEIGYAGDMIWICTDTGIGFIVGDKFVKISNIPMTTAVEGMLTDYQNNLWFASSSQGVMKIVPNQFSDVFSRFEGLDPKVVCSTCLFDGQLFVGTKNDGLTVLDLTEGVVHSRIPLESVKTASGDVCEDTDLIEMLKDSKIRSVIRDSKDRLWLSTFGKNCLVRYDGKTAVKFTAADGMPSERVRTVYECGDGSFLAACTGGLAVIRDDRVEKVYGAAEGIENTELLTVAEGINGEYLIGTDGGGLYILNGEELRHLGSDDGLPSDVIMRVKKDLNRDLYWIVMSNALAYMTPDYQVTTIRHFPYSNNFDLYQNSHGEIWVLSSNGIYVVQTEEMMRNGDTVECLYYNRDNGLPCNATSNSYSELTADGDLYIAGTTGVAKVNIEKPSDNVSEIRVSIPYMEADGAMVFPDQDGVFHIDSGVKKLTIFSFVYNYSLVNPEVSYQLDGFDSEPVRLLRSELTPVSYTNLHGGKYQFLFSIQDPHGLTSKELSVSLIKEKKVYEMAWVHACFLLLGAVLISIIIKAYSDRRNKQLTKKSEAQKQLIREIVESFSKVIDMKDQYTNGHSSRVAEYTVMLSRELGIDEETVEKYYCIALLHDIGKVGVPPEVLNKPGKLTDEEFSIIKSHSALGYDALKNISIMPDLAIGAGAHHERPDGKGYPRGLNGEEIPRVAQIIAVADCFDAMYSDRPYRKRMNFEKAVDIIKNASGTQLTPDVVDAFLRLVAQGKMRAADDVGGGTTEDITNIRNDKSAAQPKEQPAAQ